MIAFTVYGGAWLAEPLTPVAAIACFAVLFFTIIAASFGVVHEADLLAHKLGEPYGTLILTLSIVSIEVILIASVLLGPGRVSDHRARLDLRGDDDHRESRHGGSAWSRAA
ncbi:hypothetical protein [Delftia acidovorans]